MGPQLFVARGYRDGCSVTSVSCSLVRWMLDFLAAPEAREPPAEQPMLCVTSPVPAMLEQALDVRGLWLAGSAPSSTELTLACISELAYRYRRACLRGVLAHEESRLTARCTTTCESELWDERMGGKKYQNQQTTKQKKNR